MLAKDITITCGKSAARLHPYIEVSVNNKWLILDAPSNELLNGYFKSLIKKTSEKGDMVVNNLDDDVIHISFKQSNADPIRAGVANFHFMSGYVFESRVSRDYFVTKLKAQGKDARDNECSDKTKYCALLVSGE
jgi:hypothetical protein